MMRAAFSSLAFLTAGLAHAQTSEPAEGEWQVCNQTSFVLRVAAGYQVDDALQVSGWRGVNPGGCLSYEVESEEATNKTEEKISLKVRYKNRVK